MALPSKNRLKDRREFVSLKDKGKRIHSKNFVYLYRKRNAVDSRLGITVTTKIDKRAVVRNRIKRAIKDVIQKVLKSFEQPLDIVVIAKQGSVSQKSGEIKAEILLTLQRNSIIR